LRQGAYERYRLAYLLGNFGKALRGYASARVNALLGRVP
jgi:hypothetical protein